MMLELKDASLTIEGRELFKKLSFMALDGQLTCITGPAGSGKTAMVQVMLGFLPLDDGLVSIDGELLTPRSASVFRRLMAYIPQHRDIVLEPAADNTSGLETVWAPYATKHYHPTPIDSSLNTAPMSTKSIIIADDPEPSIINPLRSMANNGHTVIVTTQCEEIINLSDKIITLGNHDTVIS